MKALRVYGVLGLGYCLWRLLFPPWIESQYGEIWYPDTVRYRLGHHWRFSAPMHWSWSFDTRTSIYVADWGARIDCRLMVYEIALGLVSIGFLVLLVDMQQSPVRTVIGWIARRRRRWLDWGERSWSHTHVDGN